MDRTRDREEFITEDNDSLFQWQNTESFNQWFGKQLTKEKNVRFHLIPYQMNLKRNM